MTAKVDFPARSRSRISRWAGCSGRSPMMAFTMAASKPSGSRRAVSSHWARRGGQIGQRRLGRLVGGRKVGLPFRLGEQIGGERHGVRVEAGLQSAAAARRGHGFQHGLHRAAAAPFVDLHREGGVHHRVVHEQRVDGRAVEHDAGHRCAPVGERAGEVVLGLAHGPGVHERHVRARGSVGWGFSWPKGASRSTQRHGFERQLVQARRSASTSVSGWKAASGSFCI